MSPVPPAILEAHKNICLRVDVCYVNNLLILTTIFRVIKFRTVSILANTTNLTTLRTLLDVISVYLSRDFVVFTIHADNSFNGLHQQICSAGEHAPEVERSIRTLKECCGSTAHSLPFKHYPSQLVMVIVRLTTHGSTGALRKGSDPTTLSPRTIVWGDHPDYNANCRLEPGTYCEMLELIQITNTQAASTVGAIALGPADNSQGGYKFLDLNTNRVILRNQWRELPIPNEIVTAVESLAASQGQSDISKNEYHFTRTKQKLKLKD